MKSSYSRIQSTKPIAAIGLVVAMLGALAPTASWAQQRDQRDPEAHHDMHQDVRHDPHRAPRDYHHDDRYRDGGYAYGPPPVVYAPQASPGISLFLPLEFR